MNNLDDFYDNMSRAIKRAQNAERCPQEIKSELAKEFDRLSHLFQAGIHVEQGESGRRPDLCVLPEDYYLSFEFAASEYCVIQMDDPVLKHNCDLEYMGVKLYFSKTAKEMVFGHSTHE